MLNLLLFTPVAAALVLAVLPLGPRGVRALFLIASGLTLALALWVTARFEPGAGLQFQVDQAWIPAIGAAYALGVDGLSLPLVLLTTGLFVTVALHTPPGNPRPRPRAALFLVMETGLLGVFLAQDLLLFYLFFEVALVPMYFVIGVYGHDRRRYAAMKFFLYTRAGSLAMLLAFLGLWLGSAPHTFSLAALSGGALAAPAGGWILLGLLLGFGVKLPSVPVHNWLPDAHVEAPTEGSVVLAALQLKMGAYGLLRVVPLVAPEALARWGGWLVGLGLASLVFAALAALAQSDLKRLVAYTSINHMGYVSLAVGTWALVDDPAVRALALTGGAYQMISHGLLTGGMFYAAGMLEAQAGTRELPRFGGLLTRTPLYAGLVAVLAFGSLGLPGLSGFVAEFQVLGAVVSLNLWVAAGVVLGLVVTTALYLRVVSRLLLHEAPADMPTVREPPALHLGLLAALAAASVVLGVLPSLLEQVVAPVALAVAGAP